jgi:hypothetical protein
MTRRRVAVTQHPAARLAEMVLHVIEDYRAFAAALPEQTDTKAFAARHAACRAALAHLEHLLRLTRAMSGEIATSREAALTQAEAALAEARSEMALLPPSEEDEEEAADAGTDATG